MNVDNGKAADRWRRLLRRRWVRGALAVAVVLAIAAIFRAPIARRVANFLIAQRPGARADYLVVLPAIVGESETLDETLRSYTAGEVHGIVLFELPVSRAVRCGAWPDIATAFRSELVRRGVPPGDVVLLPGPCRTARDAAEAVRIWLQDRPQTRLLVLGRLLRGRCDRQVFGSVLGSEQSARIDFAAVHTGVDQNNWWRSREGILLVFQNYAALAFNWWNGSAEPCRSAWTLDEFEASLPPAANQ